MNASQVAEQAEAILRGAAREQTRLSFAHRKAAERLHRAADELKRALAPLGIDVQVISIGTDEKESEP